MKQKILFVILLFVSTNTLFGQKNGIRFFVFPGYVYNYINLGYERHFKSNQTIEFEAQAGMFFNLMNEEYNSHTRLKTSYKLYFPNTHSKNSYWLGYLLVFGKSYDSSFSTLGGEVFRDVGAGFSLGKRFALFGYSNFCLDIGINYNVLLKEKIKKTIENYDFTTMEVEIVNKYSLAYRFGGILNIIIKF